MDKYETDILFEHTRRIREKAPLPSQREALQAGHQRSSKRKGESRRVSKRRRTKGRDMNGEPISDLPAPWFQRSWSVRPKEEQVQRAAVLGHSCPLRPSNVLTNLSSESMQAIGFGPAEHFSQGRIRSWRHDPSTGADKPLLRRVVHATYGDLLQDGSHGNSDPPGFIAVPKTCDLHGDALYHTL